MSNGTNLVNLDYQAATRAQAALANVNSGNAATMDTVATNALGVLLEMGVYSCCLFLLSRRQAAHKKHARALLKELITLLGKLPFSKSGEPPDPGNAQAGLGYVAEGGTKALDHVVVTRQVVEQVLLYVRYGAAALKS